MRYEGRNLTIWDRQEQDWRAGCIFLAATFFAGILVGILIASCTTPRTSPSTTPSSPSAQISDIRATARPTPETTAAPIEGSARTSTVRSVAPRRLVTQPPAKKVLEGLATYYDDGPGMYAAVNSFRWGDPRYEVRVCLATNEVPKYHDCVMVTVRDHCTCLVNGERRLIDLSPAAFQKLAPLSVGKAKVGVTSWEGG